jgi:hypothetical protein
MNLYVIQIPKEETENKDIGTITHYIKQLEKIKAPSQCVEITFSGYGDTTDEVFEIQEIRGYVTKLLKQAPEILYYTSISMETTTRLLSCAYDVETIRTSERMNSHEVNEYFFEHGEVPQYGAKIIVPDNELLRLYAAIKSQGIKRKDLHGAGQIVKELRKMFDK